MAGKPLSWKWKLLIAFVVLAIIGVGFIFTAWGHGTLQSWINKTYQEAPASERAASAAADHHISLAWWVGTVCGQRNPAIHAYKDFMGMLDTDGKSFWDWRDQGRTRWNGKFERLKDGTYVGWGILHERAPEAYWEYLNLYYTNESGQYVAKESIRYHTLFYDIYRTVSKTQKPHPKFYKYWEKIKNSPQFLDPKYGLPPPTDPKPADFEGPIK